MQQIEHIPFIPNWAVIFFIIALGLFAWLKFSSSSHMVSMLQAGFNTQTANRLYREKISNILHPSFRYNLLFYITAGVFLFHLQKIYYSNTAYPEHAMSIINIAAIFLFFNIKYLLYAISGKLFKTTPRISEFLFYSKTTNRILGIFMLPLSIIMFFTEGFLLQILAVLGLLTFLYLNASNIFRSFAINALKDFSNYYLILYLCSLEILPLLLLWKIFR
jgi:hypothetical protein